MWMKSLQLHYRTCVNMMCLILHPILIIITLSAINSSAENEIKNVCSTPDCQISSEMLKMCMNSTVDPCHNFYEYACGNFPLYKKDIYLTDFPYSWARELSINVSIRADEFLNSKNMSSISQVITSTNISTNDTGASGKMQLFYKSCLNTTNMDSVAEETIKDIMSELGLQYVGFSNRLTGYKFNWFRAAAKIKRVFGIDFLIMTEFVRDEETNTTRLQISNPNSCTPPFLETREGNRYVSETKVFKSKVFSKYAMNISEIFLDMYGNSVPILRSESIGESRIQDMADFMLKRIEMCEKSRKVRNILTILKNDSFTSHHEKMSLKSLKEKTEAASSGSVLFDWEVYLNTLFEGIGGVNVDDELELYVEQNILIQMIELLKVTSTKTLALALWFDAFTFMVPFTTPQLRSLDSKMKMNLRLPFRSWENDICSPLVEKNYRFVLFYHLYYDIVNDPKALDKKKQAERMVDDLKHALHEVIGKSEWLDEKTRVEAEKKITQMRSEISHPSWVSNRTLLDLYYENYKIKEDNFLLTLIGMLRENVTRHLAVFESPPQKFELEDMIENPLAVNAVYNPSLNKIGVTFAIMNRPFFGHPLTAMNYGGLGMVIGHEVTHGFDPQGSKYDEKGQRRNWWEKKTREKYEESANCFVNAYDNISIQYTDKNVSITMTCDGERTLNENVADNGGMREALIAYRKWVSHYGDEPFLVGFENFSHEQLLTLTYGLVWCATSPLEALAYAVSANSQDVHAQNEARVNGVFMNSEEMSRIWNCPKGSPMNPEKKCRIW